MEAIMERNTRDTFIGMGTNPDKDAQDIPLGFGIALQETTEAYSFFGTLSNEEKAWVIDYIHSSVSGDDAKRRIRHCIEMLGKHSTTLQ